MKNLSKLEWARLEEMARSLLRNAERTGDYWTVGDTFIDEEIALLRKLSKVVDVEGLIEGLSQCATITEAEFRAALKLYGIENGSDEMFKVNCWMLQYGPKIVVGE